MKDNTHRVVGKNLMRVPDREERRYLVGLAAADSALEQLMAAALHVLGGLQREVLHAVDLLLL